MAKGERYRFVILGTSSYQITDSSGTAIMMPSKSTATSLHSGIVFSAFTNIPENNKMLIFDSAGVPYTNDGTADVPLSFLDRLKYSNLLSVPAIHL